MIKAIGLTIALMLMPMSAMAQGTAPCAPRNDVISWLAEKYGESLQIQALMGQQRSILEIYANTDTGTWTAMTVDVNGNACKVADGDNWTTVNEPPKGQGTDG